MPLPDSRIEAIATRLIDLTPDEQAAALSSREMSTPVWGIKLIVSKGRPLPHRPFILFSFDQRTAHEEFQNLNGRDGDAVELEEVSLAYAVRCDLERLTEERAETQATRTRKARRAQAIPPDGPPYDLFLGEVAQAFGCRLDETGAPLEGIYFQTLEMLQDHGYDIGPLSGLLTEDRFFDEYDEVFQRLVTTFRLTRRPDVTES